MPSLLKVAELGHPVLRLRALPVSFPLSPTLQAFMTSLMATAQSLGGMGIAAPQVFESKRIFVMASRPNTRYKDAPYMPPTFVINPTIRQASGEPVKDWEGCLSIPGIRARVPRYPMVSVAFRTQQGDTITRRFEGFLARLFQHEYDHLEGTVFLDRVTTTQDVVTEKMYQTIIANTASV